MRRQTAVAIALGVLVLGVTVALVQSRCGAASTREAPAPTAARPEPRTLPGPAVPSPLPRGELSVRGRVIDSEGRPVPGVQVSATRTMPGESLSQLPCDEESPEVPLASSECAVDPEVLQQLVMQERGGAPVLAQTTTGADGTFQLDKLPEGMVALWAIGEDYSTMEPEVAAGSEGVELVLTQGLVLAGRVVDEQGAPVVGATVTLFHQQHSRYFTQHTHEDGRFGFDSLPAGEYGLVASSPGLMPVHLSDVTNEDLTEIILYPPRQAKGRVVLADGSPAPGAEVRVQDLSIRSEVDVEGRFTLGPLAPGNYMVFAERDGQYGYAQVDISQEGQGEEATVYLGTLIHVEGTVRDEAGRPIAGASVSAYAGETAPPADDVTTDAEGHFRIGPIAPAAYVFSVDAEGYLERQVEDVEVSASSPPLSFTLARAFLLSGIVTDTEGHPLQDIELDVVKPAAPPARAKASADEKDAEEEALEDSSGLTDEEGHFVIEVAKPGRYVLTAGGNGFLQTRLDVEAPATTLKVVLRGGATLEGTVVDTSGTPLDGVQLTVRLGAETQAEGLETTTDERGAFRIAGLPPGTHVLRATLDRGAFLHTASRTVSVRGTEKVDASLRMDTGGSVSGVVVDGDGRPVPDAEVEAYSLREQSGDDWGATPSTAMTDAEGRFTVRHLPEGECGLRASKQSHYFEETEAPRWPGIVVRVGARDARLVLRYQGFLLGHVVHRDGTPFTRFTVDQESFHAADGAFRLAMQKPGPRQVRFEANGLPLTVREVEVPPGKDVDMGNVVLEPGRQVHGRVVDAETSQPVARAIIRVHVADDEASVNRQSPVAMEPTLPDGTFTLPLLERRPLELEVLHDTHTTLRQQIGADAEEVELHVYPGAKVDGTVTDHEGRPVDTKVFLTPVRTRGDGFVPIGHDDSTRYAEVTQGRFHVEGVAGGDYVVSAREVPGPDGRPLEFLTQRVRLPPMGRVTLALTERKGSASLRLRVRLNAPEGQPGRLNLALIPGSVSPTATWGELRFLMYRQSLPAARGGPDGTDVYEHIPAGHYTYLMSHEPEPGRREVSSEEVDVAEGESLVRDMVPRWRPVPGSRDEPARR
ncbi:carboxypeptidase regulatory-like domain-containing protein [Pyxidicoccus parkwayensis]|uniref:Carboxypeptidase regulatory-like domain-containing protein n=1 Tax=Pyxidicoccus parkwayensis TaxID=2813578 RepID=A0ABX7NR83_9BACT|nr:carboxypeptidase-like regulatory domain-containing protein [Pyxidicoccus parkwaysis]QSQ21290.1 carboxypeptidase regulatory-like domain-containing protein [Pyxidicoccus parkwaysis]